MEYAVYRVFSDEDGRRMGSFVNMFASRAEAEVFARGRDSEHEVVALWTREISEEDDHLWDTVTFDESGGVEPAERPQPGV